MSENQEQQTWDQRWSEKSFSDGWQVDSWLAAHQHFFEQGTALDVACGRGRNSLFLAGQGYQVTALDYSQVALTQLQEEASRRGLTLTSHLVDLEQQPQFPEGQFDLIINFYYMHRPLLPIMQELVKPGGLIIIRTFSSAGNFEPCRLKPEMVLEPQELRQLFSDWEILVYEEGMEASKKGGSLVGIIARKPGQPNAGDQP